MLLQREAEEQQQEQQQQEKQQRQQHLLTGNGSAPANGTGAAWRACGHTIYASTPTRPRPAAPGTVLTPRLHEPLVPCPKARAAGPVLSPYLTRRARPPPTPTHDRMAPCPAAAVAAAALAGAGGSGLSLERSIFADLKAAPSLASTWVPFSCF
jgi:hypothetical protein